MEEQDNLFTEKKEYLITVLEEVKKRDAIGAELDRMKAEQKKKSKAITAEEKSIQDEINNTIKKRKQELSDTYDGRLDDNHARKKKVESKRSKHKMKQMNERIADETKDIRKDNHNMEIELKTMLKQNKVSSFCSTKIFFAMFMPHGIDEILTMLLCFFVYLIGIPFGLMLVFKAAVLKGKNVNTSFWCMFIFAIIFILFMILYFIVYNNTKGRHGEVLRDARAIRDKIKINDKRVDAIRVSINKDKDESVYDLDSFDHQLDKIDKEADAIGKEKKKALSNFEDETKQIITDEINNRRMPALLALKAQKVELDNHITDAEKKYSDKVLQITNKYAKYLGEDLCKQEKLSDIIALMEEEQIETVSEAIALFRGKKSVK